MQVSVKSIKKPMKHNDKLLDNEGWDQAGENITYGISKISK